MAVTLSYFMLPEDELSFLRAVEALGLVVFPEAWPVGYRPFPADAEAAALLGEEAYYLALPAAGEVVAREVRRGPQKGLLEIDEVRSPVVHFERSLLLDG